MGGLSDAKWLAREINSQAKQHERVSMLLMPQAEVRGDDIVIAFYWLDRDAGEAHDSVVQFADYASQPIDQSAKEILNSLVDTSPSPPD